jgi:Uma2 family endonuclease
MVLRERLYTAKEFKEIAWLPENEGKRLELDDGVIVEIAPSKPVNTVTAGLVIYYLNAFVIPNRLTVPDGGFELAPDLAVEVVSEDEDIFKKARDYLYAGTKIVWAIYYYEKAVYVLWLDENGEVRSKAHDINATLEGGEVLPGFKLPVRDIFLD